MDRREFVAALALSILAAPLAGEAQPPRKVWRIGTLSGGSASAREDALRRGLRELGYVEGQNLVIESRYAEGDFRRLPKLAAELVQLNLDVIVASQTDPVRAVQRVTKTIPIVMAFSADPVRAGLIASLSHPGGNITGLSTNTADISGKRLELLKAVVPKMSKVAYLATPSTPRVLVDVTEAAGRTLGVQVDVVMVRDPSQIESAFAEMTRGRVNGVIVDLDFHVHRARIAALALKSRLPSLSGPREFAQVGGLIGFGPDYDDLSRRAATYVDKILKGAKPAELPIEQPTKFDLVINLKTAKALGLTIPPSLLLRADEVIQ